MIVIRQLKEFKELNDSAVNVTELCPIHLCEQVFSVLKFCVFIKGKKNRYKIVAEPCLILTTTTTTKKAIHPHTN